MKNLIGKLAGFFGCMTLLAGNPLDAKDLDEYQQLVVDKFNNYLKNDSSCNWDTYGMHICEALKLTHGVKDEEMLYQFSLGFAKSGNVGNARNFALRLKDPEMFPKRYEIAEMLIKKKNPNNGTWILEKMPKEYQLKGLDLLIETKNPKCAREFKRYIETGSYNWR